MKIEFTEDYGTAKKGLVVDTTSFRAKQCILMGVAKEYKKKRKTKENKIKLETK